MASKEEVSTTSVPEGSATNDQMRQAVQQTWGDLSHSDGADRLLELVEAQTFANFMHNAVSAQQNARIQSNAALTATCARILSARPARAEGQPPPSPGAQAELRSAKGSTASSRRRQARK